MSDDGSLKDDVKMPDGEMGEKITKIFRTDEKETSEFQPAHHAACNPPQANLVVPDVVILKAMGEEAAVEAKEAPRQN